MTEQEELDKEYDIYINRLLECRTDEEIKIEFGLHFARLNMIAMKYKEVEKSNKYERSI